jgi:hypothetical protein
VSEFPPCWSSISVESEFPWHASVFYWLGHDDMRGAVQVKFSFDMGLKHPLSGACHPSQSCIPYTWSHLFGIGRPEPRGAAPARSSLVVPSSVKAESLRSAE